MRIADRDKRPIGYAGQSQLYRRMYVNAPRPPVPYLFLCSQNT